ncbi:membrane protein required for colicin V production [Lampropedia hyalina DSM 16112]|jgi:membrane protein required for colicin V production|uniref:Membrane protein required for colicin V production n=1 Tax=Lampropedia hyalina DSM 16112 TaxID=1122156 RepID=A0A1M4Z4N0_9BURK|nr:CvpA family protein [Lampropedia hyalina]SHF12747.1 membrane protein required for colicin V production [Lampropedia hyalina DSM 16112]
MNWLDLTFLLLALLSVVVGAWRGFVFECISLAGWIAGFWVALHWGPVWGSQIPWDGIGEQPKRVAGMVLAFVLAMFASSLLASWTRKFIRAIGMRAADRAVGAGFGLVRVLLVGVGLAVVLHAMQWNEQPWWQQASVSMPFDTARLELMEWFPQWKILQPPEQPPVIVPSAAQAELFLRR